MLNRRSILTALPAALALPSLAAAASLGQEQEESKLAEIMGDFNRSLRKLKGATESDEALAAALTEVRRLQHAALDAKNETPPLLAGMEDEKQRARAHMSYCNTLQDVVVQLFAAENASMAGDKKAFGAAMKELNALKKKGHGEHKPQW